jgi:putative ABC transport system ATP-binding protein
MKLSSEDNSTYFSINNTSMISNSILDSQQENKSNDPFDIFNLVKTELGPTIVQCHKISKVYKLPGVEETVKALYDISLDDNCEFYPIKRGEFVIIRGPSGGGKTTLLNILGTLDSDFEGELSIMNNKITKNCTDEFLSQLRLKNIGFVFQSFNLISTMTAFENVCLPMTIDNKLSESEKKNRAKNLLKRVGLEDRMDHLPSELSGGEQQRVAIARALSNQPDILLLDEPTGDLDSTSTIEVMNLLLSINKFGPNKDNVNKSTIVMVTHNPELECYANRILYVQDGVFIKQAINEYQQALTVKEYLDYINSNQ